MTVTREVKLKDFEFWGGAKQFTDLLTAAELTIIESCFDDDTPKSETEINDFIWFSPEVWTEWIGETEESILARGH